MANTTLTRKEYLTRLRELINQHPEIVEQLKADNPGKEKKAIQQYFESKPEFGLGKARWRFKKGDRKITGSLPTADDLGEDFILTSSGKGNLAMKAKQSQKNYNNNNSAKGRYKRIKNANGIIDSNALEQGEAFIDSLGGLNNADHILEVQTFGPIMEQLEEEFIAGAITQEEFDSRLNTLKESNPGNHIDNLQELPADVNNNKKDVVKAKNGALEAMEKDNPSARHMEPGYKNAMERYRSMMNKANSYKGLSAWANHNGYDLAVFKTGAVRQVDQYSNIMMNAATGNFGAAALGTGFLASTELIKNPKFQATIGTQIGDLLKKRGKKTAMKMIPGLDVVLSGQETLSYLKQGKLDQAGIALLSGAIGWIPVIGDGLSASLDLTNTGLDIARLNYSGGIANRSNQPDVNVKPTRSFKI